MRFFEGDTRPGRTRSALGGATPPSFPAARRTVREGGDRYPTLAANLSEGV